MGEQKKQDGKNKLVELAVKQNLLLWQLSKSFLDIEKKIKGIPTVKV